MKQILLYLLLLFSLHIHAQRLRVAVAANAQSVVKILQADFKKKTGITVEIISGSSGKLAAQIKNGAPFDLFLSADMEFPESLYKEGFALNRPAVYALGNLILCSLSDLDLKNWNTLLTGNKIQKIAIANPSLAPYGEAAVSALRHYGIKEKIQPKLVTAESVSQVNTYITTGVVDVGFTSESFIHETAKPSSFHWVRIDHTLYGEIRQGMVILKYAKKNNYSRAMSFYQYLSSPAATALFKKNGYRVP
jgi:molybdate transport system substrate-binding protein